MAEDIRPISCPNCGGTVEGSKCPYCGSVFWDVADLEIGKPAWLRFKHDDKIFVCKAIPERISITHKCAPTYLYADNIKNDTSGSKTEYGYFSGLLYYPIWQRKQRVFTNCEC